ncbi:MULTISPECIES: methylmalonyl-CoA decarboxylase [unclassified Xanthobacter]|uniref:methylmalonyl-CoA decarboxylase n=1 Tax=unclassified Xanthobacter TaxID=2623496 RepID=UPI001F468CB8|nr:MULTISPECIES: methylmalonyl-CoA decarboxylase [unclassified Xanthobacter]
MTVSQQITAPALVRYEILEHVGVITLDNPSKRNALSRELMTGVLLALDTCRAQSVRVVVIRAAPGMQVWSAGHDIHELPRGHEDPLSYRDPLECVLRAIRTYPGAVIAMVQGAVWGGAFDLVLSCDMIIADETSTFAITPANLSLPYNTTGLLHFLHRLPVNLVKEMFFSAQPLAADAAERWGIINRLVPAEEIESHTLAFASLMASKAPLAIAVVKEQLRVLTDDQPVPAQVFERIQDMRRQVFESADYEEGITAFLEKRKPVFRGV